MESMFASLSRGAAFSSKKHGQTMQLFNPQVEPILSLKSKVEEESFEELTSSEEINAFRNRLSIKVKGERIPAPSPVFASMEFHSKVKATLLHNIEESKWKEPTPIQMQAIPALLQGRDVLAAAPTGSGKTAAYSLPLISKLAATPKTSDVRALIIAPTRELADQIHREILHLSGGRQLKLCVLKKAIISSAAAQQDTSVLARFDVVISTPMRLLHVLRNELIDLSGVNTVILDEVDKLFELDGHTEDSEEGGTRSSFLAQVDEILSRCTAAALQRCLFSATLSDMVLELSQSFLHDAVHITIGKANAGAASIEQQLVFVSNEEGKLLAMRQLIQQGLTPPVLVFVQSKERAQALLRELIYDGINVDCIHAERTQAQREAVIAGFRRGDIWVLLCTDLMARGVDFKGVQMVINYDLPQSSVAYIHRIGRTGRAGLKGKAVSFFTEADVPRLRSIANVMRLSGCDVPDWMLTIKPLSTKEKRSLRRKAPDRRDISTESKFDRKLRQKRKLIVEQSKRKKQRLANRSTEDA